MPDRADIQFIFGDAKRPLRFRELNVAMPERSGVDVREIAPQQIAAIGELRPIAELRVALPGDIELLFAGAVT